MVWQHPETVVDPLLRLKDTLEEAGEIDPELTEKLHIEKGWLERFPTELSGGELQRFCLARALHSGTRFLLCDEISAMLDLVTQAQIWDLLLKEAEKRELGLLVVSHMRRSWSGCVRESLICRGIEKKTEYSEESLKRCRVP